MHKPEAYEVFHHPFLLKIDIFCKTPKEALEKKSKRKAGSSKSLWMRGEVPWLIYRPGKYLQCPYYTCSGDKERI